MGWGRHGGEGQGLPWQNCKAQQRTTMCNEAGDAAGSRLTRSVNRRAGRLHQQSSPDFDVASVVQPQSNGLTASVVLAAAMTHREDMVLSAARAVRATIVITMLTRPLESV
jgi:hypothetical protein